MNPTPQQPRRRRPALPMGLVGMVLLIVAGESLLRRRDAWFVDPGAWDYRFTVGALGRGAGRSDVLCFGDSLIKLSAVPRLLTEGSGLKAYNLAISGSQTPASYYLLR